MGTQTNKITSLDGGFVWGCWLFIRMAIWGCRWNWKCNDRKMASRDLAPLVTFSKLWLCNVKRNQQPTHNVLNFIRLYTFVDVYRPAPKISKCTNLTNKHYIAHVMSYLLPQVKLSPPPLHSYLKSLDFLAWIINFNERQTHTEWWWYGSEVGLKLLVSLFGGSNRIGVCGVRAYHENICLFVCFFVMPPIHKIRSCFTACKNCTRACLTCLLRTVPTSFKEVHPMRDLSYPSPFTLSLSLTFAFAPKFPNTKNT